MTICVGSLKLLGLDPSLRWDDKGAGMTNVRRNDSEERFIEVVVSEIAASPAARRNDNFGVDSY